MGVKIFCAEISSNQRVKTRQEHVKRILDIRGIPYEAIDITAESNTSDKEFMKQYATRRRGSQNLTLAPQIFNDDVYCGDYEDFDEANEAGTLLEFLRLNPETEETVATKVEETGPPSITTETN